MDDGKRTARTVAERRYRSFADIVLTSLCGIAAACLLWLGLTQGAGGSRIEIVDDADTYEAAQNAITVVIDAGHGGADGGAVGSYTGVVEAELNLIVAQMLAEELTSRGMYVIMTRNDGNALADTKEEDMLIRKEIMQLDCVDYCISIHMNKFTDSTISGPMVFYMKGSEQGQRLAEAVMSSVCTALGRQPRFANPEDLFVLRVPNVPSILVECGFLSNRTDEQLLSSTEHQMLLAKAVADGLCAYIDDLTNAA